MTIPELEAQIAMRDGEIAILKKELTERSAHAECFLDQLWFWRAKYLKDHPEKDTWEFATEAYTQETGKPSSGKLSPPSEIHENLDSL